MKIAVVSNNFGLPDDILKDFDIESLSSEEKSVLFRVLSEYADEGQSEVLSLLWKQDYDEVPVSIEQFITDDEYLGKSTNKGTALYPFWRDILSEVYKPGAKYFEVIFSGAIGIGKTTIAVIGIAYMLHKLMCLKVPSAYYELTPGSKIIVAFFNITLDLSRGVAFNRLQEMLQSSPWFMKRGNLTGQKHPIYVPNKNIDFRVGSTERHGLGQDIFCLAKGTEIVTDGGVYPIEKLVDKPIKVFSYNDNKLVVSDECTVKNSGQTTELIELGFENGVTVRCTPDHRWLVRKGGIESYVFTNNIKVGDDVVSVSN